MPGALREVLARFGIRVDDRQLDRADRRIRNTEGSLRRLAVAAGGAATLHAFGRFIGSTIAMGDDLDKTATQLGFTIQQLQALQHAAALGGVDASAFAQSMRQLQRNAEAASRNGGEMERVFQRLGVTLEDSNGNLRTGHDLFIQIARGLSRMENSTERVALAQVLLGESGARMIPMFASVANGTGELEAELARLGGGAGADFIRMSVQLTDELTRFRVATTSLRSSVATGLLPTLTRAVTWLTRISASLSRTGGVARATTPLLVALGAAAVTAGVSAAIAWGGALWPVLAVAAGAAALYLVIEDIHTGMLGGKSVIANWGDALGEVLGIQNLGRDSLVSSHTAWQQYFNLLEAGLSPMEALGTTFNSLWETASDGSRVGLVLASGLLGMIAIVQSIPQWFDAARTSVMQFGANLATAYDIVASFGRDVVSRIQEVTNSITAMVEIVNRIPGVSALRGWGGAVGERRQQGLAAIGRGTMALGRGVTEGVTRTGEAGVATGRATGDVFRGSLLQQALSAIGRGTMTVGRTVTQTGRAEVAAGRSAAELAAIQARRVAAVPTLTGPTATAAAQQPQVNQNVQVDGSQYTVTVNEATDIEATRNMVRGELDRHEQSNNRRILAALEPARAGAT